jgi:hypothetical protein
VQWVGALSEYAWNLSLTHDEMLFFILLARQ